MNRNRIARTELDQLLRENLLDADTYRKVAALYPLGRWDWLSLGRWFLLFGAISAAAGLVTLLRSLFVFTLLHLAFGLALAAGGLFVAGRALGQRRWRWSALTAELLGGGTLVGLSFVLGAIFDTGSGDWPALLFFDLIVLLALSYALNNVLLLILSGVVFFTWFGGETGYSSGWGAYWFGMNYPLRFLGMALLIATVGFAHLKAEHGPWAVYRGFSKVWISFGLFLAEMALWLLSIFGNFDTIEGSWREAPAGELVFFNLCCAALNIGLLQAGIRYSYRMLRAYGATFFIIQAYTLFFTYVGGYLGWLFSLLIGGGSALGLALWLESRRRGQAPA
ncbi:hypothetical protein [Dyella sp. C9]|uniref:hypothetical protein n=1 Tax=Dyella sp. C9 TaxID=2202154 RepID=UPI000DEFA61C|nr:hypothetical protein [Dyella sp. C9]